MKIIIGDNNNHLSILKEKTLRMVLRRTDYVNILYQWKFPALGRNCVLIKTTKCKTAIIVVENI